MSKVNRFPIIVDIIFCGCRLDHYEIQEGRYYMFMAFLQPIETTIESISIGHTNQTGQKGISVLAELIML